MNADHAADAHDTGLVLEGQTQPKQIIMMLARFWGSRTHLVLAGSNTANAADAGPPNLWGLDNYSNHPEPSNPKPQIRAGVCGPEP